MALSLSSRPMTATTAASASTALPAAPHEAAIWNRLGQAPRSQLDAEEIADLFRPGLSQPLRAALAERLGMHEARALLPCLALIQRYGPASELLMALGMTHQPAARDKLFSLLDDPAVDRAALLRSLACWGRLVKLEVILDALQHPAESMRQAGLELLQFHARLLKAGALLHICEDLLNDVRPQVVITTIRLLQRRSEAGIVERLAQLLDPRFPDAVCDAAIQALGCIGTETSVAQLMDSWLDCRGTHLGEALTQQLGAQFRYRNLLLQQLSRLQQQGVVSAAEIEPLRLMLQPT